MARLGVNIDHVATLRQARMGKRPDLILAALEVQRAGADGVTVHLREDRRHIQDDDVIRLRKRLGIPLNLEMAATGEMVRFACRVKPDEVCLVPEKRRELTTEGGLNVLAIKKDLAKKIRTLKKSGIRVSIFVDPDLSQVRAAKDAGSESVELHTGRYADAQGRSAQNLEFKKLVSAGKTALDLKLILNAGHGLDYHNVRRVARIGGMAVLNIGFSIVSRSLFVGLGRAVRDMKALIRS